MLQYADRRNAKKSLIYGRHLIKYANSQSPNAIFTLCSSMFTVAFLKNILKAATSK